MAIDDPEIVDVSVIEPPSDTVEVDNDMDDDFRRMSISQDIKNYDYKTSPDIDEESRALIARLTEEDNIRPTRRTSTMRKEGTITIEDGDEPESISSALKQKYSPMKGTTARRTSNKIVPLDSYIVFMHRNNGSPVIIIFDSLGLRHNPVFKTLRDYLVEEAKSKHDMDLSKDDIAGLHAKVEISKIAALTKGPSAK
jgi:hypothetical protein